MIKDNTVKTIFDYKKYTEFIDSKLVRKGKDRTYTIYDFITEEQEEDIREKNITDLTSYNPTPQHIIKHFAYINQLARDLQGKYPNDEFLKLLDEEENQAFKVSTDWFKRYSIEYEFKDEEY